MAEKLENPPIEEVVCGFVLEPTDLTLLDIGVYWESRRAEFPTHTVKQAIFDGNSIHFSIAGSGRAWLVSADDTILLQIQPDRLYVNWRRRNAEYPRFSNHDGEQGLKELALEEFAEFCEFVVERTGKECVVKRVELTKIDTLKLGRDYTTVEHLGRLLPISTTFSKILPGRNQNIQLRMTETIESQATDVSVVVNEDSVRIETRHRLTPLETLGESLVTANDAINRVFFELIVKEELGGS